MKKFRFLSSLTLASTIVSGVTITSLAAGSTGWTGVLEKGKLSPTVVDKDVVGYLLTDAKDTVTVDDILKTGKYTSVKVNGETANAEDTVKTGDYYTSGSKTEKRHIVVYNDVNRDGKVTIDDATDTVDIVLGNKTDAEDLQKEAADVQHNGKLTIDDATRIVDFTLGNATTPVDPAPQGAEDVEESAYTITVNGNNTVNSKNLTSSSVTVALKSGTATENTTLSLKYLDDAGEPQEFGEGKDVNIAPHASQNQTPVEADFTSALGDEEKKDVTVQIYDDSTNELVGETVVKINTHIPEAVQISARRAQSYEAHLSFKGLEDSDIVKAYYKISTTSPMTTENQFVNDSNEVQEGVKVFTGLNNSCDDRQLEATEEDLPSHHGAKVYFIVEDSVGNRSGVYTAVIPTDDGATQAKPAKGPDGEEDYKDKVKVNKNLTATWGKSEEESSNYIVRVYDESGKIIKEYSSVTAETQDLSTDITEVGKYTVEVVVKGNDDGSTTDSTPIKSDVFEIKKLDPVTNVTFTANKDDNTKATLTWEDKKHENDKAASYEITVQQYSGEGDLDDDESWTDANVLDGSATKSVTINGSEELKAELTGVDANILYRAKVYVKADTDQKMVKDSDETYSTTKFFTIDAATITVDETATTDKSVTLDVNIPDTLGNTEFTYEVEIYTDTDDDLASREPEKRTVTPTIDEDGKVHLVIDGLTEGTDYKFVVTMKSGDVSGTTSRANETALAETTKLTAPVVKGIVTKDLDKAKADKSKVYASGNKLVVNGTEYDLSDTSDYYDPDKLLDIAKKLVPQLGENDEIISISKDEISIKNGEQAKSVTLDLTSIQDAEGNNITVKKLKIEGNVWNQTISSIKGVDTVALANGEFDIGGLADVAVELEDNTHVTNASTELTLAPNANVKVNGISIVAKNGVKVTPNATANSFTFEPSEDSTSTIEITNETDKDITVSFKTDKNTGNRQLGKVTIKSKADVTVKTESKATVTDIEISSEGNVDVTDPNEGYTGSIDVTVSAKEGEREKTITAYSTMAAPFTADGSFEIRNYTDEELQSEEGIDGLTNYEYSAENAQKLKDYIATFNTLIGKGVKLTVTAGEKKITLTVPEGVTVSVSTDDVLGVTSE